MEYKDYYKILGVPKDATKDDIQRAYRKLARKYHPDVSKVAGSDAKFNEICEAKEVLKDPEKRKLYDLYGKDWETGGRQQSRGGDSRHTGSWNTYSQTYRDGRDDTGNNEAHDFSDFFNNLFGGRGPQKSARAGTANSFRADGGTRESDIEVELSEVFHGTSRTLKFRVYEASESGQVKPEERTLQVKIPRGVTNGSVIRLAGQGGKGFGGGRDGDLLLRISVKPDPRFHIVGHDLHTAVAVSPWEAALGAKIPVKTVGGYAKLTIPPGTQSGKQFRMKGLGIPRKGTAAGDIIVVIEIRIPTDLSEEEKQLIEKISSISGFNPREEKMQRAT